MKTDPDAADLFGALKTLLHAPTLLTAARNAFDAQRTQLSQPALNELIRLRIVQARHDLETVFVHTFTKRESATAAQQEIMDIERQLKTIEVRIKRAESEAQRPRILKSKTDRWEDDNRLGKLKKEREALISRRHRRREDCEEAKRQWAELIALIDGSSSNQNARWTDPHIIGVSDTSYFLFDELNEMNPDNFHGRSIGDVLQIGPLLG